MVDNLLLFIFQGENIADNAGLKAAYHAFLETPSLRDMDHLPLPGINLTHRQLFFVSFAQVNNKCSINKINNLSEIK